MRADQKTDHSDRGSGYVRPRRRSARHRLQRRFSKRKVSQLAFFAFIAALSLVAGYLVSKFL
jgi:hypothetical protein